MGRAGLSLAFVALISSPPAATARPHASRASTLHAKDVAHLHYVAARGSILTDEGQATGTVPGHMKVHLRLGATFSGSFTLYTSSGTINGRGSATPHGSGTYESFAGSIVATGGTGRYTHAHGRAQLYGVFNRSNYSFVIQTTGTLYF